MRILIEFSTENDSFDNPDEVYDVFEKAVKKVNRFFQANGDRLEAPLMDSNGNTVGMVTVEK